MCSSSVPRLLSACTLLVLSFLCGVKGAASVLPVGSWPPPPPPAAPALQEDAVAEARQLNQQAIKLYEQGQYDAALPLAERARAMLERALGANHPEVGVVTNNVAEFYRQKGDHVRAEQMFQRALAIYEKTLGPDHKQVGTTLNNLASLYQAKGDYARAEPLYLRALSIDEKALGPNDPAVATDLSNLADLYALKGNYARSEELQQRALSIDEKALGPNHPDVGRDLSNLGRLYFLKGDYTRAEPLYQRTLTIAEKALGPEHPHVATVLNNFAELYAAKGDYARAEPLHQRALAIREKTFGASHPDVAQSLINLAGLYQKRRDYERASSLYMRALSMVEQALGPEHPYTGMLLNNVALLLSTAGDYDRAEKLFLRALSIQEKVVGADHPDIAPTLNNLALVYQLKGDYARAEPLYMRALSIDEKAFGQNHPINTLWLSNLAVLQEAGGNTAQAVRFMARNNAVHEHNLGLILTTGSEDQKRRYLDTILGDTYITVSLHARSAPANTEAARLALTNILQRKGRALDAMTDQIASLRRRLNAQDRALLDALSAARSELATRVLKGAAPADAAQHRAEIAMLEAEVERLEAQVSARSAEFRVRSQPVTLERVQRAVPAGAALVEIASYRPLNAKTRSQDDVFGAARYVAYVLRREGEPSFVDLGEAAAVDPAIAKLHAALSDPRRTDVRAAARALDELVMRPVRRLLGDVRMLLVSPDGALNLVPFAALVDEQNRYLVEGYTITYLTSGRDLLRLETRAESRQETLVMANPSFDVAVTGKNQPARSTTGGDTSEAADGRRSGDLSKVQWTPLAGTAGEAAALKTILTGAQVLTEGEATESALKQVTAPRILHIATHGFFLPDQSQEAVAGTRGLTLGSAPRPTAGRRENPLLRSGLILAGVNRQQGGGGEDGVLTALEAAGLDLWGTQLVVLSACETGVGDVKNGDGVYGLRRALVLAGAESELMSLWQVDDAATRDLMVEYYRRLEAGEGRAEALRQVQLMMIKSGEGTAAGAPAPAAKAGRGRTDRSHPFFWASFIPVGDWRSLGKDAP